MFLTADLFLVRFLMTVARSRYINNSTTTPHHFVGASPQARAWAATNGYQPVPSLGPQGWVWPWSVNSDGPAPLIRDGTAPLQHFFSSHSNDTMLVAERATMQTTRADGSSTCSSSFHKHSCGYSFVRIDALYPTQRWTSFPGSLPNASALPPPSTTGQACPFERSEVFNRVVFSDRVGHYPSTAADTWYPSWGADDILYSIFTDGEVGFRSRGSELIARYNDPTSPDHALAENYTNRDRELTMPASIFCCSSCAQSVRNTGSAMLQGSDPFGLEVFPVG